jgi:hypothetical protein
LSSNTTKLVEIKILKGERLQPNSFLVSDLFADLVDGLVDAQKKLDQVALEQRERFLLGPQGTLDIPPLWFHFGCVKFDMEVRALAVERSCLPLLTCCLIDPVTSTLIETDASIRSNISVTIEPITKLSDAATGKTNTE